MDLDFNIEEGSRGLDYGSNKIKWNVKKMSNRKDTEEDKEKKYSKERIMTLENYSGSSRIKFINLESQTRFIEAKYIPYYEEIKDFIEIDEMIVLALYDELTVWK